MASYLMRLSFIKFHFISHPASCWLDDKEHGGRCENEEVRSIELKISNGENKKSWPLTFSNTVNGSVADLPAVIVAHNKEVDNYYTRLRLRADSHCS